jgi:hypothetical protein
LTYSTGMSLPLAENAFVDQGKVEEYLLSVTHPDGQSKARFFIGLGFQPNQWRQLADALRAVGTSNPVFASVESPYGTRYVVDGPLATPVNRSPRVRTVWILEADSAGPRLVTAYPLEDRL